MTSEEITDHMINDFVSLCTMKGYQIRKEIGKGNFGRTYLGFRSGATGPGEDGTYAIKLALDTKILHAYLEREASIQKSLNHENIVKVYEVFNGNGYKVIVMELMELSLFQYLLEQPGYCISEREAREFTRQIVAGLLYIHRKKLTHRDIKPENILMKKNPANGKWILKIADFGFVKDSDSLTTTLGTPEYMAPDIFEQGKYGPEVDLWALGGVVYFMLNGSLHTGRLHGSKVVEYVKSFASFELKDNEVKRFSQESKDFVKSLLTSDPAKRIKFEELSSHPFLAPKFYFTIAINMKESIPLVYNEAIDFRELRERPITWGHITNYISRIVTRWGYVSPGSALVAIVNGEIVNSLNPIDEALLKADAVNVYVFVQNETPKEVNPLRVSPVPDFNPQEVDQALYGKQVPNALQAEAQFYLQKKDWIISLISRAGMMRAEALRFIDELEKGCQSYVNAYLIKATAEANAHLGRMGFKEPLPLLIAGGTKKALENMGHYDMGFMEALQQDTEVVKAVSANPNALVQQSRLVQAAFYRFRNQHLHALTNAAKKETANFLVVWNKIACLVESLAKIFNLSNLGSFVKTATTEDEIKRRVKDYVRAFNMLMYKNTTWTQTTAAGVESKKTAEDAQTTIAKLRESLRQAEARIKDLEKENEDLRTFKRSAEAMLSQQPIPKI